ncbi:FAD binding domain-containing protein, partial [Colletotrichum scovillei]
MNPSWSASESKCLLASLTAPPASAETARRWRNASMCDGPALACEAGKKVLGAFSVEDGRELPYQVMCVRDACVEAQATLRRQAVRGITHEKDA